MSNSETGLKRSLFFWFLGNEQRGEIKPARCGSIGARRLATLKHRFTSSDSDLIRENAACRSRTCNLRLRRPTLYPIELRLLAFRAGHDTAGGAAEQATPTTHFLPWVISRNWLAPASQNHFNARLILQKLQGVVKRYAGTLFSLVFRVVTVWCGNPSAPANGLANRPAM